MNNYEEFICPKLHINLKDVKDALRCILHTIIFSRSLGGKGVCTPVDAYSEQLNIFYLKIEDENLDVEIEAKIRLFSSMFELGITRVAQLCISFYEFRERSLFLGVYKPPNEKFFFEIWRIPMHVCMSNTHTNSFPNKELQHAESDLFNSSNFLQRKSIISLEKKSHNDNINALRSYLCNKKNLIFTNNYKSVKKFLEKLSSKKFCNNSERSFNSHSTLAAFSSSLSSFESSNSNFSLLSSTARFYGFESYRNNGTINYKNKKYLQENKANLNVSSFFDHPTLHSLTSFFGFSSPKCYDDLKIEKAKKRDEEKKIKFNIHNSHPSNKSLMNPTYFVEEKVRASNLLDDNSNNCTNINDIDCTHVEGDMNVHTSKEIHFKMNKVCRIKDNKSFEKSDKFINHSSSSTKINVIDYKINNKNHSDIKMHHNYLENHIKSNHEYDGKINDIIFNKTSKLDGKNEKNNHKLDDSALHSFSSSALSHKFLVENDEEHENKNPKKNKDMIGGTNASENVREALFFVLKKINQKQKHLPPPPQSNSSYRFEISFEGPINNKELSEWFLPSFIRSTNIKNIPYMT